MTGQYLSGKKQIEVPKQRHNRKPRCSYVARRIGNNLKDVGLTISHGLFNAITGVSGSGKST